MVKKNKHRIRCVAVGSLDDPDRIIATTAALSQRHLIVQPRQLRPHTATDTTMGSNSLTVICTDSHSAGHRYWNLSPHSVKAPHHQRPDALDVIVSFGDTGITPPHRETPFHSSRKISHHCRSDRKPTLRRTQWSGSLTEDDRLIICRRNVWPARTTLQACWRRPMSDSSSHLRQLLLRQSAMVALTRANFSGGRERVSATVSMEIPRKAK